MTSKVFLRHIRLNCCKGVCSIVDSWSGVLSLQVAIRFPTSHNAKSRRKVNILIFPEQRAEAEKSILASSLLAVYCLCNQLHSCGSERTKVGKTCRETLPCSPLQINICGSSHIEHPQQAQPAPQVQYPTRHK